MFARQEVTVDLDFPTAKARLALLMRGDWLEGLSQDAYAEGLSGQVRVGPFGPVPGMSKLVEVRLLDPVPHEDVVVVPLRWEATGRMGRLFPVLDANLTLAGDGDGKAVLRFAGVYRPPLAAAGEELDQLVLHRVASATVRSLLNRLAPFGLDLRCGPVAGARVAGAYGRARVAGLRPPAFQAYGWTCVAGSLAASAWPQFWARSSSPARSLLAEVTRKLSASAISVKPCRSSNFAMPLAALPVNITGPARRVSNATAMPFIRPSEPNQSRRPGPSASASSAG